MGAACGKPKPYKQPDSKQVLDKAQLSTHDNISRNNTLATQQETKNFPISQTTLQNDSEKFPEREKTSSQRKNSISKMIIQSSVNLAAKMNAIKFNSIIPMEGIRRRYRFEPNIYGNNYSSTLSLPNRSISFTYS